jgi:hypothetical protein
MTLLTVKRITVAVAVTIQVLGFLLGHGLAVEVGDTLPASIELHHNFPPEKINLLERFKGKNAILVGLPGAFTPT